MPNTLTSAANRLSQLASNITGLNLNNMASNIPFDPNSKTFPRRKDLPTIPGAPTDAAWVWGPNDNLGRLNLLTPARVAAAASECIRTGEMARMDLPLDVPAQPGM